MLSFTNPGEIDIRGATIAGLSAKDGSSPIGFFGTGLKYAIACILRWEGRITIHSGTKAHAFAAEALKFRDREFLQITMDGAPLGFTTEYGKNWKPWQVFRELYANALDEGGQVQPGEASPTAGQTTIVVDCKQLLDPYNERDTIILPTNLTWQVTSTEVLINPTPSSHLYYRGVRVKNAASCNTYNFTEELQLTEDRTLEEIWTAQRRAARAIMACTNSALITRTLVSETYFEKSLAYSRYDKVSPEFIETAANLYRKAPARFENLCDVLGEHAPEALAPKSHRLSRVQDMMLAKAKRLLSQMDMELTYPVEVGDLGGGILGKCDHTLRKIYLSPEVFALGTKQVLSTLYEEALHAETGKRDCTYDMQTHLFNKIISLYEEHVFGEPI